MNNNNSLERRKTTFEQNILEKVMLVSDQYHSDALEQKIPNFYKAQFQHTFPSPQPGPQQQDKKLSKETYDILSLQCRINRLMLFHNQLDSLIDQNDNDSKEQLVQEMFDIKQAQIDQVHSLLLEKFDDPSSDVQQQSNIIDESNLEKLINLKSTFTNLLNQNQSQLSILNQDIQEKRKQSTILETQLEELTSLSMNLQKKRQKQQTRNQLLEQERNKKQQQVNILQEQYNVYKNYSRVICVFTSNQTWDGENHIPLYDVKKQQTIEFLLQPKTYQKELDCLNAKNKLKIKALPSNQYQFDKLVQYSRQFIVDAQKKEHNNTQAELILKDTKVFLTQFLYKHIDIYYKSFQATSDKYNTLFNDIFLNNQSTEELKSLLKTQSNTPVRDVKQQQQIQGIIFIVSRKFTTFVNKYLERIIQHFLSVKNEDIKVTKLVCNQMILNIKNDSVQNILSINCSDNDYKEKIKTLSVNLFFNYQLNIQENELIHFEIKLVQSNGTQRSLHMLCINIKFIENFSQFSKQIKNVFNGNKGIQSLLGLQLECLIRNSNKRLILAELPVKIKQTTKYEQKLEEIKAILEFTKMFVQKKK